MADFKAERVKNVNVVYNPLFPGAGYIGWVSAAPSEVMIQWLVVCLISELKANARKAARRNKAVQPTRAGSLLKQTF